MKNSFLVYPAWMTPLVTRLGVSGYGTVLVMMKSRQIAWENGNEKELVAVAPAIIRGIALVTAEHGLPRLLALRLTVLARTAERPQRRALAPRKARTVRLLAT